MELKDVAVISGKPGLFRIVKPTRTGMIIESIGGGRSRIVADASHRISILNEISIYTTTEEGTVALREVFYNIFDKHGLKLDVAKTDTDALQNLLTDVLPEWDRTRVYASDLKKLVTWYEILGEHYPELLDRSKNVEETPVAETAPAKAEEPKAESTTEKPVKKATKKKTEITEKEAKPKKTAAKKETKAVTTEKKGSAAPKRSTSRGK